MNLYLLDSLPPGGDYVCGEPGAKSAVGNEQLRLLWSEDRQMMLFFSFAVAWLQFYWTKLLESAFGIFFMV